MLTPEERIIAVLADKGIDRETRDRLTPELANVVAIVRDHAVKEAEAEYDQRVTDVCAEFRRCFASFERQIKGHKNLAAAAWDTSRRYRLAWTSARRRAIRQGGAS